MTTRYGRDIEKREEMEDADINSAIGDASTPRIELPQDLDPAAFRGPIGEFARDTGWTASLASPLALLITGLAAYGSLAGRAAWNRWGGTYGYATIFATLIGPTGLGAKGLSRRVTDRYMKQVSGYKVLSNLTSGEGLIKAVAAITPDHPTVEDRRCIVITEEISSLLKAKDRDNNTLGQTLIEAYDCLDLGRHTVRDSSPAENPAISAIGHVTPEVLMAEVKTIDIANGFINRFLLLPSMARWNDDLKERPESDFKDLATTLTNNLTTIRDPANVGPMWFSDDALDFLQSCDRWQFTEAPLIQPLVVSQLLQREAQQAWRLSMAYALSDARRKVEAEDVLAALAITDLSERTVRALFTASQPLADDERAILNWMRNRGDGPYTGSQITRGAVSSRYRDRAMRALPSLVLKGRVLSRKVGHGAHFTVAPLNGAASGRSMREAALALGL